MALKKYVCIICPNSCEIEVDCEGDEIKSISGNICQKGEEYVRKEIKCPERGLTTSVRLRNGSLPIVSVKTSRPIPKEMIMKVMDKISEIVVDSPVKIGDVIMENVLDTGADIIVTKNINKKVQ